MTQGDATKILLVDDHPVVRRGVAQVIIEAYPRSTIRDVSSAEDALASARSAEWDLVILDLTLRDGSGLDVLKQLKKIQPRVPVMILSIHPADQFARRCISAGASGYLTKAAADSELATAVARLISGGTYFGDEVIETAAAETDHSQPPHQRLSDREYEVLRLIGEGRTVTEIAKALTLSVKTVSTYRTRLMTKMGLRTTAELVHYAVRAGLIKP